jgi:hypothetical protein
VPAGNAAKTAIAADRNIEVIVFLHPLRAINISDVAEGVSLKTS